jgi:hypothetical protein
MTGAPRSRYVGVVGLVAGAALCIPQVAGAVPGSASGPAVATGSRSDCNAVIVARRTSAKVTPDNCSGKYILVSYKAHSRDFNHSFPQHLFDHRALTGKSVSVRLPYPCFWQVDFVTAGPVLPVIDETHRYGDRVVASLHGGFQWPCSTTTTTTEPATTTTTVPATTTTTVPATTTTTVPATTTTTVPATTTTTVLATTTTTVVATTTTLPGTATGITTSPSKLNRSSHAVGPNSTDGSAMLLASAKTGPLEPGSSHNGLEAVLGLGLMGLGAGSFVSDKRRRRV